MPEMTPPIRLALAYVPSRLRPAFALLLQIDNRFVDILHNAREPMIAQIKMAWWREAFGNAPDARPKGEPLLQALNDTGAVIPATALEALALAWEQLLGSEVFSKEVMDRHAELRAEAIFQTYADWISSAQDIMPLGRLWAIETLRIAFPHRVPNTAKAHPLLLRKTRRLRPLSILTMSVQTDSGPRLVWHALTGL